MKDLLTARHAVELLREIMPDGTAPALSTFAAWSRPSWRRKNSDADVPAPAAYVHRCRNPSGRGRSRTPLWDRDQLTEWARRRIKRINRGGERATNR